MILNKEIIERIVEAFDKIVEEANKEREDDEKITGIKTHEYYELSVPRGDDPTSKYLVEYKKIEHFLNTEHPEINLSNLTKEEMKEVLDKMLSVYLEAHK